MLELLGAAILHHYLLCRNDSLETRHLGLLYWKKALQFRNATDDSGRQTSKVPYQLSEIGRRALGFSLEFTTLEQLEQLETQEDIQLFTQVTIVIERIMSQISPGPHLFIASNFNAYANKYYENNCYGRVVEILMFMLELFKQQLSDNWIANYFVNNTIEMMIDGLLRLERLPPTNQNGVEQFSFENLMKAFNFAFSIQCRPDPRMPIAAITRLEAF